LHEPPRRVLVELPQNKITLSDYVFPGERLQESLIVLKELLDLEIFESQVQEDVEQQVGKYCLLFYTILLKILSFNAVLN
jgi:hypothetical protein